MQRVTMCNTEVIGGSPCAREELQQATYKSLEEARMHKEIQHATQKSLDEACMV
jgi:hypothetical protein